VFLSWTFTDEVLCGIHFRIVFPDRLQRIEFMGYAFYASRFTDAPHLTEVKGSSLFFNFTFNNTAK